MLYYETFECRAVAEYEIISLCIQHKLKGELISLFINAVVRAISNRSKSHF